MTNEHNRRQNRAKAQKIFKKLKKHRSKHGNNYPNQIKCLQINLAITRSGYHYAGIGHVDKWSRAQFDLFAKHLPHVLSVDQMNRVKSRRVDVERIEAWIRLKKLMDEGKASVVLYGKVDTINTGLEINDLDELMNETGIEN